jgi:hypothetical protein
MQALRTHLQAHASASFALPDAASNPPTIEWAGALTGGPSAPTTLPAGVIVLASSPLIGGPIRDLYKANLPGDPRVDGVPCLAVSRPYTCKGEARSIGAQTIMRLRTDAPVLELTGVVADGLSTTQTLIVDGELVPPTVLCASRGVGGWSFGTIRIDFGSRAMRDIWIETGLNVAYLKMDSLDTLQAPDDSAEPQITVVGDSYLQSRAPSFGNGGAIALEIATRLGVRKVATDGIGGTGYQNSGNDLGNLNDRLAAHSADDSLVYLVLAGLNDYGDISGQQIVWSTREEYEQSVRGYLKNLRKAQRKSLIVVTAPFCPVAPMSDSAYVSHPATNSSGVGDFLYTAQLHKAAVQDIDGPWIYIDVLLGGGWLNSSGAKGDVTNLQWFTGGTPGINTSATNKPGNTLGGGGGGFGGIARVPILTPGQYTQAPEVRSSGGAGKGLLLASKIDSSGALTSIEIVQPGFDYSSGSGLPAITLDTTYQITAAQLGEPETLEGVNETGAYPLPAFAPAGATDLNNIYRLLMRDKTHPSPLGVQYLSTRLARNVYDAVMAL